MALQRSPFLLLLGLLRRPCSSLQDHGPARQLRLFTKHWTGSYRGVLRSHLPRDKSWTILKKSYREVENFLAALAAVLWDLGQVATHRVSLSSRSQPGSRNDCCSHTVLGAIHQLAADRLVLWPSKELQGGTSCLSKPTSPNPLLAPLDITKRVRNDVHLRRRLMLTYSFQDRQISSPGLDIIQKIYSMSLRLNRATSIGTCHPKTNQILPDPLSGLA